MGMWILKPIKHLLKKEDKIEVGDYITHKVNL